MSHFLPPQVMAFFAPRPPLPFVEPEPSKPAKEYTGVGPFMSFLANAPPAAPAQPTRTEQRAVAAASRAEEHAAVLADRRAQWDPHGADPARVTEQPARTLFVGRLPYALDEQALAIEFAAFGEVKKVVLPRHPRTGRPRGYGFVEFATDEGLRAAHAKADGQALMGRRIVVDIERGRTQEAWLPRRLGGGLGRTRAGDRSACSHEPGRDRGDRDRAAASTVGGDRDRGQHDRYAQSGGYGQYRHQDRRHEHGDRYGGPDRRDYDRDRGQDRYGGRHGGGGGGGSGGGGGGYGGAGYGGGGGGGYGGDRRRY